MAVWDNPSTTDGVTLVSRSTTPKSDEAKFARKILDNLDKMSFSVEFMTGFLVEGGNENVRLRLVTLAKGILYRLAQRHAYEPDRATREAYRLVKALESAKTKR